MPNNRNFVRGVRFLIISTIIIAIGVTICSKYDIDITEELQQEIRNTNALEKVLSYCTLANDKILLNVNISSLPFLYSQSNADLQKLSLAFLIDVLTINVIFSELYCKLAGYKKEAYCKPVRITFAIVGMFSEFELTYCSHAFLVFLSHILPDNFGNLPFFTWEFGNIQEDSRAYALSQITIFLSLYCFAVFLCIVLVACIPNFLAIVFVCTMSLVVLFFASNINILRPLFTLVGLLIRWLLGNSDLCAGLREGLLEMILPYMARLTVVIGFGILLFTFGYFSV